jgi:coenzyme Q-binding protein COQ10
LPKFEKLHPVPYSAEQMFDLVADAEKYPLFLPLCERLTVRSRDERDGRTIVVADMTVGYKAIRETFTSRVILNRGALKIDVKYLDGPFRRLDNRWQFEPATGGCTVRFAIDYEFSNRVFAMLMGAMIEAAFRKFTAAFEARAREVYGPPGRIA